MENISQSYMFQLKWFKFIYIIMLNSLMMTEAEKLTSLEMLMLRKDLNFTSETLEICPVIKEADSLS